MARRSPTFRRRCSAGAFGLAVVATAVGCTSQVSSGPNGGDGSGQVLVCESGVETHGNVHVSSAVVLRVPDGTAVPPGCRLA